MTHWINFVFWHLVFRQMICKIILSYVDLDVLARYSWQTLILFDEFFKTSCEDILSIIRFMQYACAFRNIHIYMYYATTFAYQLFVSFRLLPSFFLNDWFHLLLLTWGGTSFLLICFTLKWTEIFFYSPFDKVGKWLEKLLISVYYIYIFICFINFFLIFSLFQWSGSNRASTWPSCVFRRRW